MSDFNFDIGSDATITSTSITIKTRSNTGLDLTGFLSVWADDAGSKVPFELDFTIDGGAPETVEVTRVNNNAESSQTIEFVTLANTLAGSGVLSAELGLKVRQLNRPCGGYEEFVIDDDDPTCTNSCVFRNVSTGREFSFSNVRQGNYSLYFEGPNERYEIIWATPSGNCNPDKIKILNRVQGKTLFLEDYGNGDPEDINFGDLIITIKNGSYEWAGGDEDPVFYTTANNGTLCGPGLICNGGNCVESPDTGYVDVDDILLLHESEKDNLYNVRAGDYMVRAKPSYGIPITRGSETFSSGPFDWDNIEDADFVSIYRPSTDTVYHLTGKQYYNEFYYPPFSFDLSIRLYKKIANGQKYDNQAFVLEIDSGSNSRSPEIEVITRIIHGLPWDEMNSSFSLMLIPDESSSVRNAEYILANTTTRMTLDFNGDTWWETGTGDYEPNYRQLISGASLVVWDRFANGTSSTWRYGFNDDDDNRWRLQIALSGTPDFSEPWVKTLDFSDQSAAVREEPIYKDGISFAGTSNATFSFSTPDFLGNMKADAQRIWLGPFDGLPITRYMSCKENDVESQEGRWEFTDVDIYNNTISGVVTTADVGFTPPLSQYRLRTVGGSQRSSHHYVDISSGNVGSIDEAMTNKSIGKTSKYEFTFDQGTDAFFANSQGTAMICYARVKYGNLLGPYVASNYLKV